MTRPPPACWNTFYGIAAETDTVDESNGQALLLRAKINQETSTAPWRELQRFFAQGSAVFVDKSLDLVEVACSMSLDRSDLFTGWLADGRVALVSDQQAKDWVESDAVLWTLVVKPWVLVQEMESGDARQPEKST